MMKAHPLNSFWSIGHVAKICDASREEVEAVAVRLGLEFADMSINGVPYFSLAAGVLIQDQFDRDRTAKARAEREEQEAASN